MVKGISKQVIVVHSPEPKLFEQAIFILKEDAVGDGITDEALLREAKQAIHEDTRPLKKGNPVFWAIAGACLTGLAWLISSIF